VVELEVVMRVVACVEQGDAEWAETYGGVGQRFDGKTRGRCKERKKEGETGVPPN
jgi:hypothetical protein